MFILKGLLQLPRSRLVLATMSLWVLVALCGWKATRPAFDSIPRRTIEGTISDVRTPLVMDVPVLDFGIQMQSLRFRVPSGMFDKYMGRRTPSQLRPGAHVQLLVQEIWLREPSLMAPYRLPTVEVDAISLDHHEILSLGASREWEDRERAWGQYLLPVFAALGFCFSWALRIRLASK